MREDFPSSRCDVIGHISRIGIKSYVSVSTSLVNPTQPQCIKRNITFAQASSFRFPHFETLKQKRRLLNSGSELTRAMNREPGPRYEILKIWVPTHGTINVYRSPHAGREAVLEMYSIKRKITALSRFLVLFLDYHVDNGFLLEEPIKRYGTEKIRILASHGSVIVITRDDQHKALENKYTIEPPGLAMDATSLHVEPIHR